MKVIFTKGRHVTISMVLVFLFIHQITAQKFFIPSDTLNIKRYQLGLGFAALSYSTFSIGLYSAWYYKIAKSSFHFFNDSKEWMGMDKCGHIYNGYFQSDLIYQGARWAGVSKSKSVLYGAGISSLFQTTIEVMDGFSQKWGFSWADIGANILGTGLFVGQQLMWDEQRIYLKFSAYPQKYSDQRIFGDNEGSETVSQRARQLFGENFGNRMLKDYNAQTYWLSFNPFGLIGKKSTWWPPYINVAFGYGAQNLLGGFENKWTYTDESFSATHIPRYQQYYFSFDLDLRKIPVKNRFLKSALHVLNIFKFPAPALEYNSLGQFKWHWFNI